MLTSIQEAVKKFRMIILVLLFLGDQPFIKKETIEKFIERIKVGDYPIIVSCYKGEGHPTFITLKFKEKILSLDPEKDALRDIIYDARNKNLVFDFETDDEDVIKDIDTYEDYIRKGGT